MITKQQAQKLIRIVNRLRKADIALSWAGGGDPLDRLILVKQHEKALKAYRQFVKQLQEEAACASVTMWPKSFTT